MIQWRQYSTTARQKGFRDAMSRIAHQAMVLTCSHAHGMTLSSVTSLSIDPRVLIQFNLQVPSTTSTRIHSDSWFALNTLPPSPRSVELARGFSQGVRGLQSRPFANLAPGLDYVSLADVYSGTTTAFESMHGVPSANSVLAQVPVLLEAESVLVCEKAQTFTVDSREIWVAEVRDILLGRRSEKTGGLLVFDRGFHKVGGAV